MKKIVVFLLVLAACSVWVADAFAASLSSDAPTVTVTYLRR
ncbi:MAG: hypothetical protein V1882_02940 [Candidatus Omnitrophota bacterium]